MGTMQRHWGLRTMHRSSPCSIVAPLHRSSPCSILAPLHPIVRGTLHSGHLFRPQVPALDVTARAASVAGAVASGAENEYAQAAQPKRMNEAARQALARAIRGITKFGWMAFWFQLAAVAGAVLTLLFSWAFTQPSGPKTTLLMTLLGIGAGVYSCFWNYGYTRLARKMKMALSGLGGVTVKRQYVFETVVQGVFINAVGMGAALVGIWTMVGILVSETLSMAAAGPIMTASATYNPVLPLDVFLVQAATNAFVGHFLSMVCSLWLLWTVSDGRGPKFQRLISLGRLRKRIEGNKRLTIGKGNAQIFKVDRNFEYLQRGSGPAGSRKGQVGTENPKTAAVYAMAASNVVAANRVKGSRRTTWDVGDLVTPSGRVSDEEALTRRRDDSLLMPTMSSLQYLDGTLPGDFGFDPLGLFAPSSFGEDSGLINQRWLLYSEIIHSRWAMLGVAGMLAPEVLDELNEETATHVLWWNSLNPRLEINGDYKPAVFVGLQFMTVGTLETLRFLDFKAPGSLDDSPLLGPLAKSAHSHATDDPMYPGGPFFNPSGFLNDSSSSVGWFKEGELISGRLAMLATLGFAVQAVVTQAPPLQNLTDHLANPISQNIVARNL